jgi:hypothetical protein
MIRVNKHILVLTAWDILRFAFIGMSVLPLMGTALTITGDHPSNYRLLLWLAAPQLAITGYLGAVSLGFLSDRGVKPLGFIGKLLSAVPAVLTMATLFAANRAREGMLVSDETELALLIRITAVVLLDLVFCIILLSYRSRDDMEGKTSSAG